MVQNPATRNRTRDHLIAATLYSQMLYQLSYSRSVRCPDYLTPGKIMMHASSATDFEGRDRLAKCYNNGN